MINYIIAEVLVKALEVLALKFVMYYATTTLMKSVYIYIH